MKTSSRRVEAESTRGNSPPTYHGEQNYSQGELRRPNPSKLMWQKPTGEESSTRHGERITCHGEFIKFCKYKRPICSFQWEGDHIIISYAIVGREKTGKTQRDPKGARNTRIEGISKIIETSWLASIPSLLLSL